MKKIFELLLAAGISVTSPSEVAKINDSSNENKQYKFLKNFEDYFYFYIDDMKIEDIKEYIENNFIDIMFENLSEYKIGQSILLQTNYQIISFEEDKLTVKFEDKKQYNCLTKPIIKEFTLLLFNYDNVDQFITEFSAYTKINPIILDKTNYIQLEIETLLENKYKQLFDIFSSSKIFLNNIDEFWEFIDFDGITKRLEYSNNLEGSFLNNTFINFYMVRSSQELIKNKYDRYISISNNLDLTKKYILNWMEKYIYINSSKINPDEVFSIITIDDNLNWLEIKLNDNFFDKSLIIKLINKK